MTAAQKKAKDNFKKAIAYRKKSGCSLKEAFAHVYGKKVGAVKKKAAPKKKAAKKVAKKRIAKKAAPKKKAAVRNYGSHKDTKSHNVNIRVVSGISTIKKHTMDEFHRKHKELNNLEVQLHLVTQRYKHTKYPIYKKDIQTIKKLIKETKTHLNQLKKHF